ncbi:hypothetical protein [Desulfosporosinus sp. SB140]|uniref:hypothetical protein n=1 Tax=Desulfosporosinus paludis TaxID=3115649 RepID=UPI00388F05F8
MMIPLCKAHSDRISAIMNTYVNDKLIDELSFKIQQFIQQTIQEFVWVTGQRGNNSTPDFVMKVSIKIKVDI